jgi:hypothetical protein
VRTALIDSPRMRFCWSSFRRVQGGPDPKIKQLVELMGELACRARWRMVDDAPQKTCGGAQGGPIIMIPEGDGKLVSFIEGPPCPWLIPTADTQR